MVTHKFGGSWTDEKLECLHKYLEAYRKIFSTNLQARYFTTHYVDAFAGTGFRNPSDNVTTNQATQLFDEDEVDDIQNFFKGSVSTALEIEDPFDQYLFIDTNSNYIESLNKLRDEHRSLANRIQITHAEANSYLIKWCNDIDWKKNRAVVFLDPYGMQVDWPLIDALAQTQAVDLWLLFPLGVAVNRLLTHGELPPINWANSLTRTFGTDDWKTFYTQTTQETLFGPVKSMQKNASLGDIEKFFVHRLEKIFVEVVQEPLKLLNSRNNPIYLLCFASSNPRGAKTAVKIAEDIIGKMNRSKDGRVQ